MNETKITLGVKGMTCEHCVASVSEELEELDDIKSVHVDLNPENISQIKIVAQADVTDDALRDAVTEAGYELVDIERS